MTTYLKETTISLCNSTSILCNNKTISCIGGVLAENEYYDFYCSEDGLYCDDLSHYVDGTTVSTNELAPVLTRKNELYAVITYASESGYYAGETAYNADGSIFLKPEVSDQGILCSSTSIMCNNVIISCVGGAVFNKEAYS